MKKLILTKALFVLNGIFLISCISPPTQKRPYRPIKDIKNAVVIGTQTVNFSTYSIPGFSSDNEQISGRAYDVLLRFAKESYGDNIDIVNIRWTYRDEAEKFSDINYRIIATGDVITINQNVGIEDALVRAAQNALKNVPKNSLIAIVFISTQDQLLSNYITSELEFIWVTEGYIICDRTQLDILRKEQNFQISGEVDDKSAVSIGKFLGANVIVTGTVDGGLNLRRLRLRILDSETARVIGVASEQWGN